VALRASVWQRRGPSPGRRIGVHHRSPPGSAGRGGQDHRRTRDRGARRYGNLADIDRLYDAVQQQHAQIDVIFANAGGGSFAPLGAISEEHYQQTFDTNVKGVLFTVQKALPLLRDGASVMLTSSVTAISGTAAFSVYSATKAAVRNFARSWILDLKDRHIRVNAVSPGPIETAGLVELAGPDAAAQQGLLDFMAGQVPLGRVGQPDEIAKAVLFLASDQASFVNGIELFVDGGMAQI
jgi:NAD(P)-dependent dehydrogenase (short-subunit alcohol dehydrogenase family)